MKTLLLRLAGPLQSWGRGSRFDFRDTDTIPTKSGVIGLVAAAMGINRDNQVELAKLAQLRMGVCVEKEGKLVVDYHTVIGTIHADGKPHKAPIQSYRQYLCNAEFLVGLESSEYHLLNEIEHYLCFPKWELFLGRKACPPSKPIFVDLLTNSLEDALYQYAISHLKKGTYRLLIESKEPTGALRLDVPIDFKKRIFSARTVITPKPLEVSDVSE